MAAKRTPKTTTTSKTTKRSTKTTSPKTENADSKPEDQPKTEKTTEKQKRPRVTILGYSATSVFRWMGENGWNTEQANKVVAALAEGGELKPSTITTGLSDGRSGKWGKPAPLTAADIKKLERAAK